MREEHLSVIRVGLQKKRAILNLIVHGIEESNGVDEFYVNKLFSILEMNHTSPSIEPSLGRRKHDLARPMKIVMKSKSKKSKVLS